ncbi:MAG: elongation factor G [Bacteroidia bacterium]
MKRRDLAWMRNIGIMAHIDAGKTTVTENILFATGRSHQLGSVDEGNTTTDYTSAERKRGITIQSAAITCNWNYAGNQYQINLIDTPGHIDFNGEVERSLRVLDGVVALFCAVAGVETQSRTVWSQASKFGLPRIAFVNKMDRPGANFERVLGQIRSVFGANAVALQLPWFEGDRFCGLIDLVEEAAWYWAPGAKSPERQSLPAEMLPEIAAATADLLERLAEVDDEFLETYLSDGEFVEAEVLRAAIRRATLAGRLVPVLLGAAFRSMGIQPLLDAVAMYMPTPEEGHFLESEEAFSGLIFKTLTDKYAGRAGFVRIRSGSLRPGDVVHCPRTGTNGRIARVFRLHGGNREELEVAWAGDIVAVTGFKDMLSGDTLCDPGHVVELERIHFPDPVIEVAVELVGKGQAGKLGIALNQLASEDPALRYRTDPDSGQLVIAGLGELHLEVVIDRLRDDYELEVRTGRPAVAYRNTISRQVRHHERLSKQNGGKGQFADMTIEVSPAAEGTGFTFLNRIVGGAIPGQFIPAIEKGLRNAMQRGLDNGYPLDGLQVELVDGMIHSEDSDAMAFEICAGMALIAACKSAEPVVMEPVMNVEVRCPEDYMGSVIGDLNRRGGRVTAVEASVEGQVVQANVPLREMFGYVASLRNLSSGTGNYTMQMAGYAPLPKAVVLT